MHEFYPLFRLIVVSFSYFQCLRFNTLYMPFFIFWFWTVPFHFRFLIILGNHWILTLPHQLNSFWADPGGACCQDRFMKCGLSVCLLTDFSLCSFQPKGIDLPGAYPLSHVSGLWLQVSLHVSKRKCTVINFFLVHGA